MENKFGQVSNTTKGTPQSSNVGLIILIIAACIFPPLFLVLLFIFIVSITKKNKDTYTPDHKTSIKGSGQGVREEIILHEKPVDYSKSTYDIYEELLNKKQITAVSTKTCCNPSFMLRERNHRFLSQAFL